MAKIIDIRDRVKHRISSKNSAPGAAAIVDIQGAREEILNRERREVKRTILTEFVGASIVIPERGLLKVALYDISESGISFDLGVLEGMFSDGDEVAMRVYLNHTTYFPFTVKVTHSRLVEDEGVLRHGAQFLKETINDVALHHFVKFIENVSAALHKDGGDVLVSNIS